MARPTRQELLRMGPWASQLVVPVSMAVAHPDHSAGDDDDESDVEEWVVDGEEVDLVNATDEDEDEQMDDADDDSDDESWEEAQEGDGWEPDQQEEEEEGGAAAAAAGGGNGGDGAPQQDGGGQQAGGAAEEGGAEGDGGEGGDMEGAGAGSDDESGDEGGSTSEEEEEEEADEHWAALGGAQEVMFVLSANSMRALDYQWMLKTLEDERHPAACRLRPLSRHLSGPLQRGAPLTLPAIHRVSHQIPTTSPHFQTADVLALRRTRPPPGPPRQGGPAPSRGGVDVVVFRVALLGPTMHGWLGLFHLPHDTAQPPQFQAAFPVPIVGVYSVAASADGSFIAACGDGGHVLVMQLEDPPPGGDAEGWGEGGGVAAPTVRCSWLLAPGGVHRRREPMLNSAKFCRIGGKERLLVARQGTSSGNDFYKPPDKSDQQALDRNDPPGMLFIYDLPNATPSSTTPPAADTPSSSSTPSTPPSWLCCMDLPPTAPPATPATPSSPPSAAASPPLPPCPLQPNFSFPDLPPIPPAPEYHFARTDAVHFCHGPPPPRKDLRHNLPTRLRTLALGPFPHELNFAVASPDGRWLGITHDSPSVLLVDAWQQQPRVRLLRFPIHSAPADPRAAACQNAAFNAASSLLAATSDHSLSVFCWHVPSGALALHLSTHLRPCLPLAFVPAAPPPPTRRGEPDTQACPCSPDPARDNLLVYAEEGGMVHVVDTTAPATAHQLLACPHATPHSPLQRLNGLALCPSGRIMVAGWSTLHEFQLLLHWDTAQHSQFPPRFKAATRALLALAHIDPATGEPSHPSDHPTGFWRLPRDVLLHIVALAAFPLASWLPPLDRKQADLAGLPQASLSLPPALLQHAGR